MDTIDGINPKSLTARLQELERNDVIERKVYLEVPPRIEYSLSEKWMALKPVLDQVTALYKTILIKYFAENIYAQTIAAITGRFASEDEIN
jgi:DNA-binding HxlR family transcriptional regulator